MGDGKASNIIIDDQDNAWLIDFGGGWTEGWVDKEVADTVEGDEQAVNSIVNSLGVGRAGGGAFCSGSNKRARLHSRCCFQGSLHSESPTNQTPTICRGGKKSSADSGS